LLYILSFETTSLALLSIMVSWKSSAFLFAVATVASALTTPLQARSAHQHHAIAARIAAPVAHIIDVPSDMSRKRSNNLRKRCKAPTSAKPTSAKPSSTPAKPPAAVANAGGDPSVPVASPTTHKTTAAAPAKSTKAATPKPPIANGPSWLTGPNTGDGTFYATGLGACGITNHDTDFIAAASMLLFDNYPNYTGGNPNNNPLCGRKVKANYQGKSVTVTITDRCVGCAVTDLDFSPSAFDQLADPAIGRLHGVTWDWVD